MNTIAYGPAKPSKPAREAGPTKGRALDVRIPVPTQNSWRSSEVADHFRAAVQELRPTRYDQSGTLIGQPFFQPFHEGSFVERARFVTCLSRLKKAGLGEWTSRVASVEGVPGLLVWRIA